MRLFSFAATSFGVMGTLKNYVIVMQRNSRMNCTVFVPSLPCSQFPWPFGRETTIVQTLGCSNSHAPLANWLLFLAWEIVWVTFNEFFSATTFRFIGCDNYFNVINRTNVPTDTKLRNACVLQIRCKLFLIFAPRGARMSTGWRMLC